MTKVYLGKLGDLEDGEDWRDYAICAGMDPTLFEYKSFSDKDHNRKVDETVENVCLSCPVMIACGSSATESEKDFTSRGGFSPLKRPGRPKIDRPRIPLKVRRKPLTPEKMELAIAYAEKRDTCGSGVHDILSWEDVYVSSAGGGLLKASCRGCRNTSHQKRRKVIRAKVKHDSGSPVV